MHPSYHKCQVRERPHSNSGRMTKYIGALCTSAGGFNIQKWGSLLLNVEL